MAPGAGRHSYDNRDGLTDAVPEAWRFPGSGSISGNVPQRLKPQLLHAICGTAEALPSSETLNAPLSQTQALNAL
jgi:hypothetical protein